MARRFSRYKWAQKNGLTGTAITAYENFLKGTSGYVRTAPPSQETDPYHLRPFSVEVTGANRLLVQVTQNAIARITTVGLNLTNLSLVAPTSETIENGMVMNISPAKLQCAKVTAKTKPVSKITGKTYTKSTNNAFSIPFGAATETAKIGVTFKALKDLVNTNDSKNSCSYTPERLFFN